MPTSATAVEPKWTGPVVAVGAVVVAFGAPWSLERVGRLEGQAVQKGAERSGAAGAPSVLLIQRKNPPLAGTWTLPGGRVEHGERLEDALRRELLEETGLAVAVRGLVEVVEVIDAGHHFVILDYLAVPVDGACRAADDAADARFVRLEDLADYAVTDAVTRVIARAVAMLDGDGRGTSTGHLG